MLKTIKDYAPHVSFIRCRIHRHALAIKAHSSCLREVLADVVKIVNYIHGNEMSSRIFEALCEEMGAKFTVLFLHTEVM